jgi:hypothetical protein
MEGVMAYFKILSRHFTGDINNEEPVRVTGNRYNSVICHSVILVSVEQLVTLAQD